MTTHEILLAAQAAKLPLALADTDTKNAALEAMAVALVENSDAILAANKQDLAAARGRISDVMLDRLALTTARLAVVQQERFGKGRQQGRDAARVIDVGMAVDDGVQTGAGIAG